MPRRYRRYDVGFREEAVKLLQSSGRPLEEVAEELGLSPNTLRYWRDKALGQGSAAQADAAQPPGRSEASLAGAAAEIGRLQRENEHLRRQRDILKKAMSILSEDPPSGMP